MSRNHLRILGFSLLLLVTLGVGCKKKAPAPPPPPPPPPAARPTATLSANPTSIERGQSSTLTWSTTNATDVSIEPGIGSVQASGSRSVRPTESTTYRLTAKGAGGTEGASARVTVTAPPLPPVERVTQRPPDLSDEDLFKRDFKFDILFDYDKYDVRDDQRANMNANGNFLRTRPNVKITIEGHCDERGSAKYNMGLGDKRATSLKDFLVNMGIAADRIHTISYGKERPVCTDSNEDCWQRNRHGHFVIDR